MRLATQDEVKGLYGYPAVFTKKYIAINGLGAGRGTRYFYFGSSNELTRRFAERMLSLIFRQKYKLWNAPASIFCKSSTQDEIFRLEKAHTVYWRLSGHDEACCCFVPVGKDYYDFHQKLMGKPYPEDAIFGTAYLPPEIEDADSELTPAEQFSMCLNERRGFYEQR